MGGPPWTRPEDCASEFGRLRSHRSRRMFRLHCTTTSSDGGPFRSQGTARALSGQQPLRPGPSGPCAAREPVLLTQATAPLTSCLLLSPSLRVHQIQTFWDAEWTTGWRGVGKLSFEPGWPGWAAGRPRLSSSQVSLREAPLGTPVKQGSVWPCGRRGFLVTEPAGVVRAPGSWRREPEC